MYNLSRRELVEITDYIDDAKESADIRGGDTLRAYNTVKRIYNTTLTREDEDKFYIRHAFYMLSSGVCIIIALMPVMIAFESEYTIEKYNIANACVDSAYNMPICTALAKSMLVIGVLYSITAFIISTLSIVFVYWYYKIVSYHRDTTQQNHSACLSGLLLINSAFACVATYSILKACNFIQTLHFFEN